MYLIYFDDIEIVALLYSGCAINVMSESLYTSLPNHLKSDFHENSSSFVQLADSRHVCVLGTAIVKCSSVHGKHDLFVHVMRDTSHPLIIGTEFMCKNNVVLDFCSKYYGTRTLKVKCKQRVIIQQNSECIVHGILPKHTVIGLQGVCTSSKLC